MTAVVGWVLVVVGVVWILQGLEVPWAPQSFMTGDPWWVAGGAISSAGGAGLLWWDRRRAE